VHLVATAREPLGLFTASWQESLKNRSTTPLPEYARGVAKSPNAIWNWRTLDLRLVLRRWARDLPPEHVHVLPLHRGGPREAIWQTFAGARGVDPAAYDTDLSFPNESMGVVEAETLRGSTSTSARSSGPSTAGSTSAPSSPTSGWCRAAGSGTGPSRTRSRSAGAGGARRSRSCATAGTTCAGDLDDLLVPDVLETARSVTSVTDAEVADVAVELVARLLGDVARRCASGEGSGSGTDRGGGGHEVVVADRGHGAAVLDVVAEADVAPAQHPVDRQGARRVAAAGDAAADRGHHAGGRGDPAEELGPVVHVAGQEDRDALGLEAG
jgi:hypothetical protein